MTSRRLIVVQARVGSSRLPGKVLLPLAGTTVLERQLERIRAARAARDARNGDELCVATTVLAADDAIVAACRRADVRCFRGHPTDLLDRHVRAGRALGADFVVKIPSDCPLIDPDAIDAVLSTHDEDGGAHDYVGNLRPPSWPDGNDCEVVAMPALEIAWREADKPFQREHTTPFIWDQPRRFRVHNVRWATGIDLSRTHRFTLDHPEDYALVCAIEDALGPKVFGTGAILQLLAARPELLALNARHHGASWIDNHRHDLATLEDA